MPKRNVWQTDVPFAQASQQDGKVYLRVFAKSGAEPIVVEMEPTEALGLAIDLVNKTRVIIERGAPAAKS